jgi:hypothetical protein
MNEGCANCSRLCSIDSHESPLGSIPPVAPAFAISSAGFAPHAADDNKLIRAMPTTAMTVRSARPGWRFDHKRRCDEHSERIMFDVFMVAADIFSR